MLLNWKTMIAGAQARVKVLVEEGPEPGAVKLIRIRSAIIVTARVNRGLLQVDFVGPPEARRILDQLVADPGQGQFSDSGGSTTAGYQQPSDQKAIREFEEWAERVRAHFYITEIEQQ